MSKRVQKIVGVIFGGLVLLGCLALGGMLLSIHLSVRENCRVAQQAHPHPGDDVAALIEFMSSESHSVWNRTHVGVWTLGRLRDPRALSSLESAYVGEPCDHNQSLCQYELAKAIKLCGGTTNMLAKAD